MLKFILASIITISLAAQPQPAKPQPPATVTAQPDPRKAMLKNLIQAGILMLEGKAYRQFIQAFVDDEDRRRFEDAFSKKGPVDYNEWGKEKGEQMLAVLKKIVGKDPVMMVNRACFAVDDAPKAKFSFIFMKGSWFIENKSQCPASAVTPKKETTPADKVISP